MVSEAQKRASEKYKKENTKQYKLMLSLKYDADIIAMLDSVGNRQGYLKSLIRADIARANSEKTKEEETMKKYTIKPEYLDLWGSEADENTVITEEDVARFAHDWETSEDELKSQLIPVRANSEQPAQKIIMKEDHAMNRIAICTINHNTEDTRLTVSYDPAQKAIYSDTPDEINTPIAENLSTIEAAEDMCKMLYSTPAWELEWIERDEYNSAQNHSPVAFDGDDLTAPVFFNASVRNDDDPGVPSGGNPWYAVQCDPSDDWSCGSFDLEEAKAKARKLRERYPDALISVIDNSLENPFCTEQIRDF